MSTPSLPSTMSIPSMKIPMANAIDDSDLMIDMDKNYDVMRKLSPTIGYQIKIESSNINKFPDIQKVLTNHSKVSAYMRYFFNCRFCRLPKGLLSDLVMSDEAYHDIPLLPLPKSSRFPR